MEHRVFNVYLHGDGEQQALVTGCLSPELRSLRRRGLLRRAWYGRFDARGPHVYLVVSCEDGGMKGVEDGLKAAIDGWLASHAPFERLDDEAVVLRHAECRGKRLCASDDAPGFVAPGSLSIDPHSSTGYPFHLFPADDEALWDVLVDFALRNAAGSGEDVPATTWGMRWLAAIDRALDEHDADAAEYWRHHATTLLPGLPDKLQADEAAVIDALPRTLGERNLIALGRVWEQAGEENETMELARRLVSTVLREGDGADARAVLREANHGGLTQMGVPVRSHVPGVLYAWQRALRTATA